MIRGILAYATSGRPGWNTNNKKGRNERGSEQRREGKRELLRIFLYMIHNKEASEKLAERRYNAIF